MAILVFCHRCGEKPGHTKDVRKHRDDMLVASQSQGQFGENAGSSIEQAASRQS